MTNASQASLSLTLWYFGSSIVPKSISAYGVVAAQPGLKKYNDYDNAVGIVEFWDGRIAHYYASRMMPHGQEDVTEIIGTEGKLTVNLNPQKNLVNFFHNGGITRRCRMITGEGLSKVSLARRTSSRKRV